VVFKFKGETLRIRILEFLKYRKKASIASIARATQKIRSNVSAKLYSLKRNGLVEDRMESRLTPNGYYIMYHMWWITPKGERWLKEKLGK